MEKSEQADVVALRGYLGEGTSADDRNLYETFDETLHFRRHLVIRIKDIVEEGPLNTGETVIIMVRREASLLLCEPVSASMYEIPSDPPGGLSRWPRP